MNNSDSDHIADDVNFVVKQEVEFDAMIYPTEQTQPWQDGPSTSTGNQPSTSSGIQPYTPKPKTGLSRLLDGTFFMYVPNKSESGSPAPPNRVIGQCVRCLPREVRVKGYSNCTSNFLTHLRRVHGNDAVEEYKLHNSNRPIISADAERYQMIANQESFNSKPEPRSSMQMSSPYQEEDSLNSSHNSDTSDPTLEMKDGKFPAIMNSLQCMFDGTFFKHLPAPALPNQIIGQCMRCLPDRVVVRGYCKSTSNFLSHLKRKHGGDTVEEYKQYAKVRKCDRDGVSSSLVELPKYEPKPENSSTDHIIKFFIGTLSPLELVEAESFTNLIRLSNLCKPANDQYELPNCEKLKQQIENSFDTEFAELAIQLMEVDYVCITVDIFPGGNWICIAASANWITKDLTRVSKMFLLRKLKSNVEAEKIFELLQDTYSRFSLLKQKIVSIIFNLGSNLKYTYEEFGLYFDKFKISYEDRSDSESIDGPEHSSTAYESDDEPLNENQKKVVDTLISELNSIASKQGLLNMQFSCSVQMLAKYLLAAYLEGGMAPNQENHPSLMEKCNSLWHAALHKGKARKIRSILGYNLKPPTLRKSNLFNALNQIFDKRDKSPQLHQALNLPHPITEVEFAFLGEILQQTESIAEAINILKNEPNNFLGILLPCLYVLRKKLERLSKKRFTHCQHLNEMYLRSLQTHFSQLFSIETPQAKFAIIAALSHPRFKNKWLACVAREEHAPILQLFTQTIVEEMRKAGVAENTKEDTKRSELDYFDFGSESETEEAAPSTAPAMNSIQIRAEVLMYRYFGEMGEELEVLDAHPEIKNIFIKYNTPMPVMTMYDKVFSYDISHYIRYRNNHEELLDKRIILKINNDIS